MNAEFENGYTLMKANALHIYVKYQSSNFHCSKLICKSETETIEHILWDCEIRGVIKKFVDCLYKIKTP